MKNNKFVLPYQTFNVNRHFSFAKISILPKNKFQELKYFFQTISSI
jgi:hypothetical protein